MRLPCRTALLLSSLAAAAAAAQPTVRTDIRAWRVSHEGTVLRELNTLLALPNLATDSVNIRRNADTIVAMLTRRGVNARLLELAGSPPVVLGELDTPGATRTLVFYAHYDGQPTDSTQWATPPFRPTLRPDLPMPVDGDTIPAETRIYARSASDDKAPIVAMLAALDALHAAGRRPSVNLKFYFEGEEEAGSPHARAMLERYRTLLDADAWLFCDGPMAPTGRMQLDFGVRGTTDAELTVYGPARGLHSGHYGNWAPNPISLLVSLLSSMRTPEGRILVPGYYDDVRPLSASERLAIARLPNTDSLQRQSLALAHTEANDALLASRITLPAMNFRGIQAGHVGAAAANVISTDARASIDFRLVPDETPERIQRLVEAHIRRQGFFIVRDSADRATRLAHAHVIRIEWSGGYAAQRTSLDLPVSRAIASLVGRATDQPPLILVTSGGSLPLSEFERVVHRPLITVPTVNYDNNQHTANENLRLANLWAAIEVFGVVMADAGPAL